MAVYCGACGVRLDGAWENGGSFRVSDKFKNGWSTDEKSGKPKISDTCDNCAKILADAVATAATEIAKQSKIRVLKLKAEIKADHAHQAQQAKDKAEFEREWNARKKP